MEMFLAIAVFVLAAAGLGLGLALTGRPPETSCGGMSCLKSERCIGCPNRHANEPEAHHD